MRKTQTGDGRQQDGGRPRPRRAEAGPGDVRHHRVWRRTHPNYNRILLSPVLAGEMTIRDIILNDLSGTPTTASPCTWRQSHRDRPPQSVRHRHRQDGANHRRLRPATPRHRLHPFMPPIPGNDLPGVISFRDIGTPTR